MTTTEFVSLCESDQISTSTTELAGQYELTIQDSDPFGPVTRIRGSAAALRAVARAILAVLPDEIDKAA